MEKEIRYAVVGAGPGGKAMASHLAVRGHPVTLFDPVGTRLTDIRDRGGIELLGTGNHGPQGFGPLSAVTSSLEEALADAEIVMLVVPASAHRELAQAAEPYLRDGQIVVLNPGSACGAIEFAQVLRERGCTADVTVAEAATFIYGGCLDKGAGVRISRIKDAIPLAALPATRTQRVLEMLRPAYPQFIDGYSVLHTGLSNVGEVFHPALALLNVGRIESTRGDFEFYIDGATPQVARALEALDGERVAIAAALGIRVATAMEWLRLAYDTQGVDLVDAIRGNPGYYGIKAPSSLDHARISESVPMNLVPIASLGQQYGVQTCTMEAIIDLACIIHHTDYWRTGRTLERLGLKDLDARELMVYLMEGELPTSPRAAQQRTSSVGLAGT